LRSLWSSPQSGRLSRRWGKAIYVRGAKHFLLIGVDHPTQDLVHALVLGSETADGFARLVTEARLDAGYPLREWSQISGLASPKHGRSGWL
jgi:hypothetical protein